MICGWEIAVTFVHFVIVGYIPQSKSHLEVEQVFEEIIFRMQLERFATNLSVMFFLGKLGNPPDLSMLLPQILGNFFNFGSQR